MSLLLSSTVIPSQPAAAATGPAARNGDQNPRDSGTFGEVLQHSRAAAEETVRKASDKKPAEQPAVRHPTNRDRKGKPSSVTVLTAVFVVPDTTVAREPAGKPRSGAIPGGNDGDSTGTVYDAPEDVRATAGGLNKAETLQVSESDAGQVTSAEKARAGLTPQDRAGKAVPRARDISAGNTGAVMHEAGMSSAPITDSNTYAVDQHSTRFQAAHNEPDDTASARSGLPRAEASAAAGFVDPATAPGRSTSPAEPLQSSASPAEQSGAAAPAHQANPPIQPPAAGASMRTAPVILQLAPEVGSPEWGDAFGKQIVWMGNVRHQVAELRLNPPDLGPLNVTLTLNDNQAQAMFVSAHSVVRAAVEAALPQLRAILADSGISLGNTSVSAETHHRQDSYTGSQAGHQTDRSAGEAVVDMADTIEPPVTPAAAKNGNAIDTFV